MSDSELKKVLRELCDIIRPYRLEYMRKHPEEAANEQPVSFAQLKKDLKELCRIIEPYRIAYELKHNPERISRKKKGV